MREDSANYSSGDDYALEFLGYQFSFGERDFEERVAAAAVRLGLVATNDLDEDEVGQLVAVEVVRRDEPELHRRRADPLLEVALAERELVAEELERVRVAG